jgi:hypothetical protein
MKKLSLIASIAIVANIGLVGCGGGSSSTVSTASNDESATATSTAVKISGTVIDPELQNATVCLDLNRDGNCSEGEPIVTTDQNGQYVLDASSAQLNGDYPLLAYGGIDKATGDDFKGKLLADLNSSIQNISPLTTLAYLQLQDAKEEGVTFSKEKLATQLGLTPEEIDANIVALADEGKSKALQVALTIQKSAEALAPEDTLKFYQDLAKEMASEDTFSSLQDAILALSPDELKTELLTFIETLMTTSLDSAYALAEEAKDETLARGIDFTSRITDIKNGEVPDTSDESNESKTSDDFIDIPENPTDDNNHSTEGDDFYDYPTSPDNPQTHEDDNSTGDTPTRPHL